MIEDAEKSGLALAALALSTASIAAELREQRITVDKARAIFADARALVRDQAGFVVDAAIAQAADDFLSIAESFAQPASLRAAPKN